MLCCTVCMVCHMDVLYDMSHGWNVCYVTWMCYMSCYMGVLYAMLHGNITLCYMGVLYAMLHGNITLCYMGVLYAMLHGNITCYVTWVCCMLCYMEILHVMLHGCVVCYVTWKYWMSHGCIVHICYICYTDILHAMSYGYIVCYVKWTQLALRRWPNVGIGRHRRDRQPTSRQRWYSVACVATVCWHSVGARRLAYRSLPMFCVWTSVVGIKRFSNKCCRSTRLSIQQLHM